MKQLVLILSSIFATSFAYSGSVTPPPGCPTISVTGTPVSCYGGTNGTANVAISAGSGSYTITWSNGSVNVTGLIGLSAGTYTVNVKDNSSGCTVLGAYVVNEPTPFNVTGTVTDVNCFGQSTGAVDITVSGATAPYTYDWSSVAGTNDPQDLTGAAAGNHTVIVKDNKNCTTTKVFTITQPNQALASSVTSTNVSCYGGSNGTIDLTAWGGTFPYSYSWNTIPAQTSQDLSGLTAGSYSVTVTDNKGCQTTNSKVITQPNALTTTMNSNPVLCYGGSTGSVWTVPSGGTAPYNFSWSNSTSVYGFNNDSLTGVPADNFTVVITDSKGCSLSQSIAVTEPSELMISHTYQNIDCKNASTGSITLNVSGATSPYSYSWTNQSFAVVSTSQNLVNVPANTYTVVVTDQNLCSKTLTQTLTEPSSELSAVHSEQMVNCFGQATGSINMTPSGGTTPYSFSWSNGATTEDVMNLIAGSYTFLITDVNGCTFTDGAIITQPSAPLANTFTVVDVNCFGGSDGAVNLTTTGGTSPYTFAWENSTYLMSMTTEDISNLPADTYTFLITDSKGCTLTNSATVAQPTQLQSTISGVNILCKGGNNGSVDLTVTGGVLPYNFTWNNGGTSEDLINLYAGTYSVTVMDAHNCSISNQITLTEPDYALDYDSVITHVKCNNGVDGSIAIVISGGTSPYFYDWSNGGTFPQITDLAAGTYTFLVTDNNGCQLGDTLVVTEPAPLTMNEVITPVTCFGLTNGIIDVNPTGGTLPYQYTWFNSMYALATQTQDLMNFPSDTFHLEIIDSNSCFYEMFWYLPQPDELIASFTSDDVNCAGGSDGSILVNVTGGNGGNTFLWSNGATTEDIFNVPIGIYNFMVTDSKNCKDSLSVQIFEPMPVTAWFDITPVLCKDQYDGVVITHASGGTGNYTYSWSNGASVSNIFNLPTANYTIHIEDVIGCTFDTTVFVDKIHEFCVYPPNSFTPNGDNYNDTWMIDNMEVYPNIELQVFNKWGNLVYRQTGLYEPWDGKISGEIAPSDTYYYILYLNNSDNDKINGSITILK